MHPKSFVSNFWGALHHSRAGFLFRATNPSEVFLGLYLPCITAVRAFLCSEILVDENNSIPLLNKNAYIRKNIQ